MSVVKKQSVTKAWLNSAANANTLSPGDFYVVERDGTYQATSGSKFVKVEQTEVPPLPDFGSAAFAEVEDFATKDQGNKADTALQSDGLKTINGQSVVGEGDIVISSEAKLWVSGTAYTAGQFVISPLSFHQYIRRTNGAGTTDPATDKTNWRLIGAGGIKSVQQGRLQITQATATVTISTVFPAACVVFVDTTITTAAGVVDGNQTGVDYTLSASSLLITKVGRVGTAGFVRWTITEYWS